MLGKLLEDFYTRHAAGGYAHVVVAYACQEDGGTRTGIFSTIDKARAWADGLDQEDYTGIVFAPYIIDEPEFGQVRKGACN